MKKLTAGIFSVLVGLVASNAADAAVASKGYVDKVAGLNTAAIEELSGTVAANATTAAQETAAVNTALSEYKSANDAVVAGKVAQTEYDAYVLSNNQEIADLKAADTTLGDRITAVETLSGTGEGSVASQIASALETAQGYADTAEGNAKTVLVNFANEIKSDVLAESLTEVEIVEVGFVKELDINGASCVIILNKV